MKLHRRASIIRMRRAEAHEGDALLVIHHMHMVVLTGLRLLGPAVMLKHAIDVMRDLDLSALFAHELLHSLSRSVVEVMRVHGWFCACGLSAEGLHLIAVVPFEVARGSLGDHVAVGVEGVRE